MTIGTLACAGVWRGGDGAGGAAAGTLGCGAAVEMRTFGLIVVKVDNIAGGIAWYSVGRSRLIQMENPRISDC